MEDLGFTTGSLILAGIVAFIIFWVLIWNTLRKKKQWDGKMKPVILSGGITAGMFLVVFIFIKVVIASEESKPPTKQTTSNPGLTGQNQNTIISLAKRTLKSINVDVTEIKIVDGRPKGGEKVILVSYKSSLDSNEHIKEIVKVLEIGPVLNKNLNSQIDSVVAVVGNQYGNARASIAANVGDIKEFMRTKQSEKYLKTWKVVYIDKTFLPVVAKKLSW